jgi:hypothetical protein
MSESEEKKKRGGSKPKDDEQRSLVKRITPSEWELIEQLRKEKQQNP